MSITKDKIVYNRSYYDRTNFINTYLSSIIALDNYLASVYFPEEPSRVIYASNEFAFRRRLRLQSTKNEDISKFQINSLNMPFMNFALSSGGISDSTSRQLKNCQLEKFGILDSTIGKKIKMSPLHLEFEATYFSNEEVDIQYVMSLLQWDGALETLIKPEIEIDGETFCNYGSLDLTQIDYRPKYSENDWLEQNKIRTVSIGLALDTYIISPTDSNFWIPKTVLLSYALSKDLDIHNWDDYDELRTGVIDSITESVTF